ncbi:hypothetical protein RDI58_013391 [Solanum bulbocastanum]|uniref:Uncharacterized protein n=1 Tax=Solanum bulbocastanum TaxID=147425 RepID=A0AAN8TTI6_SOLBU
MEEEYILVRFHHGGSFIKAPNAKYVAEREIRDATTSSYVTKQEETTDIRVENVNATEDDSDLPSNLYSSESKLDDIPEEDDSGLDEELRAF